jgi:hypothetical protein
MLYMPTKSVCNLPLFPRRRTYMLVGLLSTVVGGCSSVAGDGQSGIPSATTVEVSDPNGVDPEVQALSGPGWRWIGAGYTNELRTFGLVQTQEEYDRLWSQLGKGPEHDQARVDFDDEFILLMFHNAGVNFSNCGLRFEGYTVQNGAIVLDLFGPDRSAVCPLEGYRAVYAVAVERVLVGDPPITVAVRAVPGDPAAGPETVVAE